MRTSSSALHHCKLASSAAAPLVNAAFCLLMTRLQRLATSTDRPLRDRLHAAELQADEAEARQGGEDAGDELHAAGRQQSGIQRGGCG